MAFSDEMLSRLPCFTLEVVDKLKFGFCFENFVLVLDSFLQDRRYETGPYRLVGYHHCQVD